MFEWIKNSNQRTPELVAPDKINDTVDSNKVDTDNTPIQTSNNSDAEYTVGINGAGRTQLRLQLEYSSVTLTMSPDAVLRLIRLLEATLEECDHVEQEIE